MVIFINWCSFYGTAIANEQLARLSKIALEVMGKTFVALTGDLEQNPALSKTRSKSEISVGENSDAHRFPHGNKANLFLIRTLSRLFMFEIPALAFLLFILAVVTKRGCLQNPQQTVAVSRQSTAALTLFSDGGFLPKATTPAWQKS